MYKDHRQDPLPSRSPSGRFHSKQAGSSVTYLAASPRTAWKEVTSRWGADPDAYWMVELKVRVTTVADLTDPATQARYGVDEHVLTDASYDRCQRLAERLRAEGFEGLWTFSRADRPGGRQLVVFLDRMGSGSHVRVRDVKPVPEVFPRS